MADSSSPRLPQPPFQISDNDNAPCVCPNAAIYDIIRRLTSSSDNGLPLDRKKMKLMISAQESNDAFPTPLHSLFFPPGFVLLFADCITLSLSVALSLSLSSTLLSLFLPLSLLLLLSSAFWQSAKLLN